MLRPPRTPPAMFAELFFGLRAQGLKLGLSEWMGLMEALWSGAVEPELSDFYFVARAMLIKSEAHYDLFDQVFVSVFGGKKLLTEEVKQLLEWLAEPRRFELDEAALRELEQLPLEELRRRFEQRLKEQTERHDGGNRWIGTGGTSPFGHGGANPAGVRVGGGGGNRTAIQIASAREFRAYRSDRVLDTRAMAVALKKLRRLSRRLGDLELDVDESIDRTSRNAGELELAFVPPRKNEARVLLLMDVGGSMDPFAAMVEQLFSAASSLNHWRKLETYAFHNCVYERLEPGRPGIDEGILTAELLRERPSETFLIVVGDAYMAPSELMDPWGAIHYYNHLKTPGMVWLHRLRARFPRAVWLNPIPRTGWHGWTIRLIGQVFPMFPLSVEGIEEAVRALVRGEAEPVGPLGKLFPELARHQRDEEG
jgi:uncharacterized protein with von Willebrand factor type A (vWA) domain